MDTNSMAFDESDFAAVQRCVCASIRRTDRAITQFYDAILAPSGLHITQFGLLATIAKAGPITINRLAEFMVMDRTTLTRNLGPLVKQGLVHTEEGEDRRMRFVRVTTAGEETLKTVLPLWKKAQEHILKSLSQERVDALLAELSAVVAASQ